MASKNVKFKVTKQNVKAYELDVGLDQVPMGNNDEGTLAVTTGKEQLLIWRFSGDPGGKLSIVGSVGQKTVVEVKQSTIPPQRIHAAGIKPFTVD